MKKRFLVVSVIIMSVVFIIILHFPMNIEGRLIKYKKAEENNGNTTYSSFDELRKYEGKENFNMSNSVINDIIKYPRKYTAYWIEIELKNTSVVALQDLEASLNKEYPNLWFDKSSLCEWPLDLEPNEVYISNVLVIIKTENMKEKEIEDLVKGIGINISAWSVLIKGTKTLYFHPAG